VAVRGPRITGSPERGEQGGGKSRRKTDRFHGGSSCWDGLGKPTKKKYARRDPKFQDLRERGARLCSGGGRGKGWFVQAEGLADGETATHRPSVGISGNREKISIQRVRRSTEMLATKGQLIWASKTRLPFDLRQCGEMEVAKNSG